VKFAVPAPEFPVPTRGAVRLYRERAIADYGEAIRLSPQSYAAYFNRGETFQAMGELDKALADLETALRINQNYLRAYEVRAAIWRTKGDLERALSDYTTIIRLNPKDDRLLWRRWARPSDRYLVDLGFARQALSKRHALALSWPASAISGLT
jgi:tetratricopeptide (TPR) repeat protein